MEVMIFPVIVVLAVKKKCDLQFIVYLSMYLWNTYGYLIFAMNWVNKLNIGFVVV